MKTKGQLLNILQGKHSGLIFALAIIGLLFSTSAVVAATISVEFGPAQTELQGSIKYSVIGRYLARFERFNGQINVDPATGLVRSVELRIEADSIKSDCGWCDKIVRSPQLLDTAKYPEIVFQGSEITADGDGYIVRGFLDMHGKRREMSFPFDATVSLEDSGQQLAASGRWVINRKEFDITWNRLLDKGGMLVGNHVTVEWQVNVPLPGQQGGDHE